MSSKVAVIQKPPVLLDRAATIAQAIADIDDAAAQGASLMVFPEAYIPGYPTWIWRLRPGGDGALTGEIHARLRANAVDLMRGDLQPLQEAAAKHSVTLVVGIDEIDSEFSGTSLFNTVVVIGPGGALLNRHRKLMPTNPERMVWGMGDASGLRVVDTPAGRLGALICWESYMPLARYALYPLTAEQDEQAAGSDAAPAGGARNPTLGRPRPSRPPALRPAAFDGWTRRRRRGRKPPGSWAHEGPVAARKHGAGDRKAAVARREAPRAGDGTRTD